MPRLLLLRHAKSSWAKPGLADIDRPLATRGERAATLMAGAMAERGLLPHLILCSPARRTRETLAALTAHLGKGTRIAITGDLYEPSSGDYRAAIAAHGNEAASLLVIGHNPAIHATALAFARAGEPSLTALAARKFPTAALAVIDFAEGAAWGNLPASGGRLTHFLTPATLGGDEDD